MVRSFHLGKTGDGSDVYYLKARVKAYHSEDYRSRGAYKQRGTVEYAIWTLKNDDRKSSSDLLDWSREMLKKILLSALPEVAAKELRSPLLVCVVPRAKRDCCYEKHQLYFRQVVADVVSELGHAFVDGTKYIVRITDTRTTHLRYTNFTHLPPADGVAPYPGITKDTCKISDDVKGKNVLLIDDVYTEGVNIDEDACQALLDKGADRVTFYAVAKTVRR